MFKVMDWSLTVVPSPTEHWGAWSKGCWNRGVRWITLELLRGFTGMGIGWEKITHRPKERADMKAGVPWGACSPSRLWIWYPQVWGMTNKTLQGCEIWKVFPLNSVISGKLQLVLQKQLCSFLTSQAALEGLGDLVGQVQPVGGLNQVWFVSHDSENASAPLWLSVDEEPPL